MNDELNPKIIHSSDSHKYFYYYFVIALGLIFLYIVLYFLNLKPFSELQIVFIVLLVLLVPMYFYSYQKVVILKMKNKIQVITRKPFQNNIKEYEISNLSRIVFYIDPGDYSNNYSIAVKNGDYINLLNAGKDRVDGKSAILKLADELGLKVVDIFGTEIDINPHYHNPYYAGIRRVFHKFLKH